MAAHLAVGLGHCSDEQVQNRNRHQDLESEVKNELNPGGLCVEDIVKLKVSKDDLKCRHQ